MKKVSRSSILAMILLAGCATQSEHFIYFPDLANRTISGDAAAFREVLAEAQATLPGERLEELAEISSKFVLINPTEFLRAQSAYPECFGVDFLGPNYVDDFDAVIQENARRYNALESVTDPSLDVVKYRCISDLDLGSGT
jgi:hypothetical protein